MLPKVRQLDDSGVDVGINVSHIVSTDVRCGRCGNVNAGDVVFVVGHVVFTHGVTSVELGNSETVDVGAVEVVYLTPHKLVSRTYTVCIKLAAQQQQHITRKRKPQD